MVGTTARHGSGMQNVISYRFAFVAILRVLSSIILFSLLLILTNVDFTRAFFHISEWSLQTEAWRRWGQDKAIHVTFILIKRSILR